MVIVIAKTFGRPVKEILEQPFAITLWTWMELQETQRIERLIQEGHELNNASITSIAVNDPKQLREIEYDWKKRVGMVPDAQTTMQEVLDRFKDTEDKG